MVFFSLPIALSVVVSLLLMFYFKELVNPNIMPISMLQTKSSRWGFVLCTLVFLGANISMSIITGLYLVDTSLMVVIHLGMFAIFQFIFSILFSHSDTQERKISRKRRKAACKLLGSGICMLSLVVVLGSSSATTLIQSPHGFFIINLIAAILASGSSFFQIILFEPSKRRKPHDSTHSSSRSSHNPHMKVVPVSRDI